MVTEASFKAKKVRNGKHPKTQFAFKTKANCLLALPPIDDCYHGVVYLTGYLTLYWNSRQNIKKWLLICHSLWKYKGTTGVPSKIKLEWWHWTALILQWKTTRHQVHIITRKSSCMNARGIPTVAYQVLHLLSCTWGGVPPGGGTPSLDGGTLSLDRGYPHPALDGGYPIPARLVTPSQVPPLAWPDQGVLHPYPGGTPWLGYPHRTWLGTPYQTQLGYPPIRPGQGTPIRPGWGVPPSDLDGVPPIQGWMGVAPWLDLTGVSLHGQTDRHVSKHNLPVVLRTRSVTSKLVQYFIKFC